MNEGCRLDSLIINNFKSYRGRHVVGPFQRLTGVIGPNGAGKSNLMDAISFVLGVQARHMRGATLSDLIYHPSASIGENEHPGEFQQADVSLVLKFSSDATRTFTRKIMRGGAQTVMQVDGKTVSQDEYQRQLTELNILVKARNFLVFQGDVVDVALKSPSDLGKLFEQISGSDTLKAEYEELETEVKTIVSEMKHKTLERQRVAAQRQDLQQQVCEMEEYRLLEHQLTKARTDLLVYQLYVNEVLAGQTKETLESAEQKQTVLENEKNIVTQGLRNADAEMTQAQRSKQKLQASVEATSATIAELESKLAQASEKVKFEKQRRADLQQKQDQQYCQRQTKEAKKTELEDQLQDISAQLTQIEDATEDPNEIKFNKTQKAKYQKLKQKAATVTAGLQSAKMSLESKKRSLEAKLKSVVSDIEELQQQEVSCTEKETSCVSYLSKTEVEIDDLAAEVNVKEKELLDEQKQYDATARQDAVLLEEQQETEFKLNQLQAGRRENGRLQKTYQLVKELQEAFPGSIFGPMIDLCRPSNKKYSLAITAALGKFTECIVVDTFATAKRAVDYLKKKKSGVLEFAALDSLTPAPPDPRIRKLNPDLCRPMIDCVEFDAAYDIAFRAALQDSVVVNSLRDAETLAYVDAVKCGVRVKVITLEGEKVLKNGNITVDTALKNASSRFDVQEVARMTDRLRELDRKLGRRGDVEGVRHHVSKLQTAVDNLRCVLRGKQERLSAWNDRKTSAERELAQIKSVLLKFSANRKVVEKEIEECQSELEENERRVINVEEDVFADLAAEVDIEGLRQLEENKKNAEKTKEKKKQQLTLRQTRLRAELRRMETELKNLETKDLESQIKEIDKSLKKSIESSLQKERDELANSIESEKQELTRCVALEKQMSAAMKKKRSELGQIQQQMAEIKAEIQKQNSHSEVLIKRATELLQTVLLEGIKLPLLRGSLRGYSRLLGLEGLLAASQQNQLTEEGMEDEEESPEIDYESSLTRAALDSCGSNESIRSIERHIEEKIGTLRVDLARKTPNLRAGEKYDAVVAEMQGIEAAIATLERQKEKKDKNFGSIRRERARRFKECFTHAQSAIDKIYHRLTGGEGEESLGGQAFLELVEGTVSSVDCFSSGILYSVMPPSKRFSSLKRLSGGEKTMAALALLFSLQSFHPAPFFVLDEIDADLDPENVLSLADYLKTAKFQVIVISHSDRVFSQADSLIGIFIDTANESSDTLSLNLGTYPPSVPFLNR